MVGDKKTIMTAEHVYKYKLSDHDTVWIQVNGKWVTYPLAEVDVTTGPGDLATLTLPSDLPGNVVPADVATNYDSKSGQPVVTTYVTERYEGNKLAGFTLHAMATVIYSPKDWRTPYGRQLMISNPGNVLDHGDSGGGVFYNGQLIGVTSYNDFDPTKERTTVAPLCFTWYGWPC